MKVLMSGKELLLNGKGIPFMKHTGFLSVVLHHVELPVPQGQPKSARVQFS